MLCMYGCGKEGTIKNKSNDGWRCAKSPNSCPGVQAKKVATIKELYGVTNLSQVKEFQDKKIETWKEKYGVENPFQASHVKDIIKEKWPESLEKRKLTSLDRYGEEHYSSTEECKDRKKDTWTKNLGVDNPTKNAAVIHKAMLSNEKSEYHTKTLTLPSGQVVRYQGFENRVIMELLKSGLKETDIITSRADVPKIIYEFENKIHRYYADIYVPKYNQIIEVKSPWTWAKYKQQNLAKYSAAKESGFNISIAIRHKKDKV